jgi:mRNA-degrading endonuclease RelE of RelBE toxin-antitoxin system
VSEDQPYRLLTSPGVRRALSYTLPSAVAFAVHEFLTGPLLAAPHRVGKRLEKPYDGQWSARRGPYRVIYEIDEESRTVRVLAVDHRADAYRRR